MSVHHLKALAGALLAALLMAGCSHTGNSFNAGGMRHMLVGQTTIEQASQYLGAQPVDVWQQGDTTLVRWAYKGTVATDALYFRQEAWLRFAADGTFMRTENTINIPSMSQSGTGTHDSQAAGKSAPDSQPLHDAAPVGTADSPAADAGRQSAAGGNPLLPAGTELVPGVTYPVSP